jgi:hypothetical protein
MVGDQIPGVLVQDNVISFLRILSEFSRHENQIRRDCDCMERNALSIPLDS